MDYTSVALLILLSVLQSSRGGAATEDEGAAAIFERWILKHGKVYTHPEERAWRFSNFLRNLEFVHRRNGATRTVGLNVFADLRNEEFKDIFFSKSRKKRNTHERRLRKRLGEKCKVSRSLDWRKRGAVTAVEDQGQCGSCWAFSSTGAMEGVHAIVTGELVSLSEQELIDCDATNDGCNGGYMDYAFEWVIDNGGVDSEVNYPYTGFNGICNITKEEDMKVVTIDGYEDVAANEDSLLCAVAQQPVSAGIDGSTLDFQLYTQGIYDGDCSPNPEDIDHAVLIVGYGAHRGEDFWIVKNSWGTNWGMQGYIHIKRHWTAFWSMRH